MTLSRAQQALTEVYPLTDVVNVTGGVGGTNPPPPTKQIKDAGANCRPAAPCWASSLFSTSGDSSLLRTSIECDQSGPFICFKRDFRRRWTVAAGSRELLAQPAALPIGRPFDGKRTLTWRLTAARSQVGRAEIGRAPRRKLSFHLVALQHFNLILARVSDVLQSPTFAFFFSFGSSQ